MTDSLREFLKPYPMRRLKKGRSILYQGEIPRGVFVVREGIVKVYGISALGEEKVVTYATEGDMLPEAWLFGKSPVSLFYYDAFTDAELHLVPRDAVLEKIEEDTELKSRLLDSFVTRYVGATMHVHALEHSRAQEKVLRILQYLVLRFGEPIGDNRYRIKLRLTHQDISSMIGLSRETAAIELGKLKKRKAVTYASQRYTVKTDLLLQILGEDDFVELEL